MKETPDEPPQSSLPSTEETPPSPSEPENLVAADTTKNITADNSNHDIQQQVRGMAKQWDEEDKRIKKSSLQTLVTTSGNTKEVTTALKAKTPGVVRERRSFPSGKFGHYSHDGEGKMEDSHGDDVDIDVNGDDKEEEQGKPKSSSSHQGSPVTLEREQLETLLAMPSTADNSNGNGSTQDPSSRATMNASTGNGAYQLVAAIAASTNQADAGRRGQLCFLPKRNKQDDVVMKDFSVTQLASNLPHVEANVSTPGAVAVQGSEQRTLALATLSSMEATAGAPTILTTPVPMPPAHVSTTLSNTGNNMESDNDSKGSNNSPSQSSFENNEPLDMLQHPLHLIEATLVTQTSRDDNNNNTRMNDTNIPQAEVLPYQQEPKSCFFGRYKWLYCWMSLLLAGVVITGIVCGVGDVCRANSSNDSDNIGTSTTNDTIGTSPSTASPTLYNFRQAIPIDTLQAIDEDSQSPQAKAFQWLSTNYNKSNLQSMNDWRIHQLLGLGVIYYSFHGDSWSEQDRAFWLDAARSECDWTPTPLDVPSNFGPEDTERDLYQIECDDNITSQKVSALRLSFRTNNAVLTGNIPPELALLSSLKVLAVRNSGWSGRLEDILPPLSPWTQVGKTLEYLSFYNNNLLGRIPTLLGVLTRLTSLSLSENTFSGAIASELGQLTALTRLSLWANDLSATIPTELGLLTQLETLSLYANELTGRVPKEVCLLTEHGELTDLTLDCEDISCPESDGCFCDCLSVSGGSIADAIGSWLPP